MKKSKINGSKETTGSKEGGKEGRSRVAGRIQRIKYSLEQTLVLANYGC